MLGVYYLWSIISGDWPQVSTKKGANKAQVPTKLRDYFQNSSTRLSDWSRETNASTRVERVLLPHVLHGQWRAPPDYSGDCVKVHCWHSLFWGISEYTKCRTLRLKLKGAYWSMWPKPATKSVHSKYRKRHCILCILKHRLTHSSRHPLCLATPQTSIKGTKSNGKGQSSEHHAS